jgi:hypothetical protein
MAKAGRMKTCEERANLWLVFLSLRVLICPSYRAMTDTKLCFHFSPASPRLKICCST